MKICAKCATSEEYVSVIFKRNGYKLEDGQCSECNRNTVVFERKQ